MPMTYTRINVVT